MPPSNGAAQLFVDQNYGGASATLTAGSYNIQKLSAPGSVGNDTVSSLLIASGYSVTVYTDANFRGASTTFTADTPYVGDAFNDQISSVQVTATGQPAPPSSGGIPDSIVFVQPPPVT
ncbi:MAG: peptidase inhibitor family I36 protein [Streptosporangiaceae bacterium]|jgi:hypothetical protein